MRYHLKFIIISTKLISNNGYFQNYKHQLNPISKSTASHSTLCIDNQSSCKFRKDADGLIKLIKALKNFKKKYLFQKDFGASQVLMMVI